MVKWVVNLLCIPEVSFAIIVQRQAMLNVILRRFTKYHQTYIGSRLI